ncbi:hypothetical protein V8J88_21105 [Massilia sp. W12]|uniref:hypothetical protein n=1 Tax=Massilia sp. W12 TaxID=3126507 RepID=UPI0030D586EC
MARHLANDELRAELLPSVGDHSAIFRFAMLFNGYEYFGSLEEASAQARKKQRDNLTALRNELFIASRRSRHQDSTKFADLYRELFPLLQAAIKSVKYEA